MSSQYKLTYFNVRGRAEPARLLFAMAGVEYEDCRLTREEWPQVKQTIPTGQVPILEVDGTVLVQSMAITRYLAREFNLAGSNNLEMCKVDGVLETVVETQGALRPLFHEQDEAKRDELKTKLHEEVIKPKLTILENMLIANGGDVFVGEKITVADITVFAFAEALQGLVPPNTDPMADYAKLSALKNKVGNEPGIAAWVSKRPATPK